MIEFLIKQKRKISFLLAFAIFINCIPVYALDSNSAADLPRQLGSSAGDSSSRASDEENTENTEPASSKENADDNSSSSDEKITDDKENNNTENSNGNADETNKGENNTIGEDPAADDTAINTNDTVSPQAVETPTLTLEQAGFGVNPDTISIGSAEQMILLSNVTPEEYQNKIISITTGFTVTTETTRTHNNNTYKFLGLGSESFPFSGSISNADSTAGAATMTLPGSLFNYLSDKAKVNNIILVADKAPTADSVPLLAQNVVGDGTGNRDWNIKIQTKKANDNTGSTASAGVIGVLGADAKVAITIGELTVGDNIQPISYGNGYRGAICNEMQANSSLTFNYTENSLYEVNSNNSDAGGIVGHMASGANLTINGTGKINKAVSATNGNAGGIVGKMEKDAQININDNITLNQTVTATGGNAGGIVGSATDINFTVAPDKNISITSTICATGSAEVFAGGFAGYYTSKDNDLSFDLSKLNINASLKGDVGKTVVGGVFGILDIKENRTVTVAGKNSDGTTAAPTTTVTSQLSDNVAHYGGIVGRAIGVDRIGDKMASSFIVKDIKAVTLSNSRTISFNYGGVAGETAKSGGKSLYFNVNNVIADMDNNGAISTKAKNIGGVVGCSNENSMIDICDIKVIGNFKNADINSITRNAGLVAYMGGGAVRLSRKTDLSDVVINERKKEIGQLVGTHSSLVFAERGWTFIRQKTPQKISDFADWGEVVRLDGFDEGEYPFTYNESNHTVTTNTVVNNKVANISTKEDFAALAIAMSCTSGGALINGNEGQDLYSSTININNDINMSGTGIYSLTCDTITTTTKAFKGTINGNGKTITLNSGEPYGYRKKGENIEKITDTTDDGSGQIYDHTFIGLLTLTQGAKINDLTIDGNFNAEATKQTVTVGGISAKTSGLALENVTVKSNIAVKRNGVDAVVGGFVGCADGAQITAQNCTLGSGDGNQKSKLSITGNTGNAAQIGGFVANAQNKTTLNITNMTVNGVEIQSDTAVTAGGFLGYKWDNATVTLGDSTNPGVTVTNSSLNYTNKTTFGGMVNTGAGYWQVNNNGIIYNSGVSFTGGTNDTTPTGFIVSNGVPATERALYLEILPGGYVIKDKAITLSGGLSSATANVDEICGKSIRNNAGNNNAVISIATDEKHTGIDLSGACNTYKNKILDKTVVNKNTRYYYNLDAIKAGIGDADKLMCTALVNYRAENIRNNFSGNILSPIKGEINLTGYSYYPVSMSVSISNATITFDNKGICTAEDKASNKCPTDTNINQHYLMHCGVYYNVAGGLNVNQLTLKGTVGRTSDGNSGALVYGTISGSQSATSTVILNGITLDGITVYNRHEHSDLNNYAPLLINKIGDYVTLDVTGVTQTSKYVNNSSTVIAGSSLIGDVGSDKGTNIRLSFSNIQLDARKSENTPQYTENTRYGGTTKTIFTRATLLNSFKYSDVTSCYGRYNFIDKNCTYGYEIGNGDTGVGGRNPNNQMWYYGQNGADRGLIKDGSTIIYDGKSNKNYTNYIRYVCTAENATNSRYELDINQMSVSILEGCGTYSDPYIITDGNQLRAIAKYLNGTAQNGLGLTFDSHVLEKSYDDGSTAHTKGTGSDKHIMYIYEGKNWYEAEYDSTKKEYKKKSENTGDDGKILAYLRNAYYLIQPINNDYSITMPYDFTGLGGLTYTGNNITVFSGGVIGAAKKDGADTIYPTINITTKNGTDTDTSTINQFGGIVRTSAGAVVKDLIVDYSSANITVTPLNSISTNNLVGTQHVFGGVVGYCTAGDTIIDNVTVTGFKNSNNATGGTVSISNSHKHLPIGGYVGLVGGSAQYTGGGVIFKNIKTDGIQLFDSVNFVGKGTVNTKTGRTANSADGIFHYVNPYIGKVLDGYVASENCTLDNTDKNYKIPQLNTDKLVYDKTNDKISLGTAQQLWLLGAIVNSGAATYNGTTYNTDDGAYYRGRTRTADYSSVGTLTTDNKNPNREDDAYWEGVEGNQSGKYGYLVKNYTNDGDSRDYFRKICDGNTEVKISLTTSIDMTDIGAGFRGIGTNYTYLGNKDYKMRAVHLNSFEGNDKTITLNSRIYSYNGEWWQPHALGLFPVVGLISDATVSDLTLKGSVKVDTEPSNGTHVFTGGFTGTTAGTGGKTLTFKNVRLGGDTENSFTVTHIGRLNTNGGDRYDTDNDTTGTGGFIGGLWNINTNMVFNGCSYNNISVTGPGIVGGLVGRVWQKSSTIKINRETKLGDNYDFNNSKITTEIASGGTKITRKNAYEGVSPYNDIYGIGGLVGYTASAISIRNVRMNNVFIDASGSSNLGLDAGGFVGYVNNFLYKRVSVNNCDIVNVGIKGALRSGGLLGTINVLTSNTIYNGTATGTTTIDKVTVDGLYTLDNGGSDTFPSATGGFVGFVLGRLTVIDSTVKNSKIISKRYAGGLAGKLGNPEHEFKIKDVTIDNSIIASVGDKKGAGGIVGTSNQGKVPVYGYEILIKDTAVGYWLNNNGSPTTNTTIDAVKELKLPTDKDNNIGSTIGLWNGSKYEKYSDVNYQNNKADYGSDGNIGVWFGSENTSGDIRLIAVQTKDCYLPLRMYGNKANANLESNDVIIYADYNVTEGAADLATKPDGQMNGIIQGEGTESAAEPIGDGTSGTTTADNVYVTVLSQILTELKNGENKRPQYSNMLAIAENFDAENAVNWNSDNGGSVFSSTYKTVQTDSKYSGNFPVIVVSLANIKSVDEQIKTALSLLTNSDQRSVLFSTDSKVQVPICNTYKYNKDNGTQFVRTEPSITFNNGRFTANSGKYDNGNDQFTLIQVQYTSGTGTGDTYSVWLPIILKKTLDYKFTSNIENGTNYRTENFKNTNLLSGHGEKNTALFTFTYEPNSADWVRMLNNGENLANGYDKSLEFKFSSINKFPVGTELVLVDKAANKSYYKKLTADDALVITNTQNDRKITLNKYFGVSLNNISDMLNITVEKATDGNIIKLDDKGVTDEVKKAVESSKFTATLNDKTAEFAYYDGTIEGVTKYTVTSATPKQGGEKLREQYYLTIKTPETTEGFVNVAIDGKVENGAMATNKINNTVNAFVNALIGKLFDQAVGVATTDGNGLTASDVELSDTKNKFNATFTDIISFETDVGKDSDGQTVNGHDVFKNYAGSSNLYVGFIAQLNKLVKGTDGKETSSTASFPTGTTANVTFKIYSKNADGKKGSEITDVKYMELQDSGKLTVSNLDISTSPVIVYPESIREIMSNHKEGIVVEAVAEISFTTNGLAELPVRVTGDGISGVMVEAKSAVSYSGVGSIASSELATSYKADEKSIRYYTAKTVNAKLSYYVKSEENAPAGSSVNRLGVNGITDGGQWKLSTIGAYDISDLSSDLISKASKIKVALSLSKKGNNGSYGNLDSGKTIGDYLKKPTITKPTFSADSAENRTDKFENTFDWNSASYKPGQVIQIPIDYSILTGSGFEEQDLTYANYKVTLTVSLLDKDSKELEGSSATDYIIYTNAKVLTDVIQGEGQ